MDAMESIYTDKISLQEVSDKPISELNAGLLGGDNVCDYVNRDMYMGPQKTKVAEIGHEGDMKNTGVD